MSGYGDNMGLLGLVYISTKKVLPEGEIFRIQQQAARNNARDEVSGLLLFNSWYFLQLLEGEREQVTRTFTAIAGDDRHQQVTLLQAEDVEQRLFADWSMGLLDASSPAVQVVLHETLPGGLFMPANLTGPSAVQLMRRVRSLHLAHR